VAEPRRGLLLNGVHHLSGALTRLVGHALRRAAARVARLPASTLVGVSTGDHAVRRPHAGRGWPADARTRRRRRGRGRGSYPSRTAARLAGRTALRRVVLARSDRTDIRAHVPGSHARAVLLA